MEDKRRNAPIVLQEDETFVAYSKKLNQSLLINLEGKTIIPYWYNSTNEFDLMALCKEQNMPTTLCFKNLDEEPVYLLPITSMVEGCKIDIEDNEIKINTKKFETVELGENETLIARSTRLNQDLYLYVDPSNKSIQSLLRHHPKQDDIAVFCLLNKLSLKTREIDVDNVELHILPLEPTSNTGYVVEVDNNKEGEELRLAPVLTFSDQEWKFPPNPANPKEMDL